MDMCNALIAAAERLLAVLRDDGGYDISPQAMAELRLAFGDDEPIEPQDSMLQLKDALDSVSRQEQRAHTPGPWHAKHRHSGARPEDDEVSGLGWEIEGPPEASLRGQFARAADAHLIAAAPDLLAACEAMLDVLPGGDTYTIEAARGFMAKAVHKARHGAEADN